MSQPSGLGMPGLIVCRIIGTTIRPISVYTPNDVCHRM